MNRPLDMVRLLNDHGVEFRESSNGWLQLHCPLCYRGDGKLGLGWSGTVFSCFRCGRLDFIETLAQLLQKTPLECRRTADRYRGDIGPLSGGDRPVYGDLGRVSTVKLPYGAGELAGPHLKYLESRDFSPETAKRWGLLGTGAAGLIPWHIVAPVMEGGRIVCWQARAISEHASTRYKTCPDAEAIIPAKNCLYGMDAAKRNRAVVVTEGITKVWRLGPGAVATFGATVTSTQVLKLAQGWKQVFILFDYDEAGCDGSRKLARRLAPLGVSVIVLEMEELTDPADMDQKAADRLMKGLIQ